MMSDWAKPRGRPDFVAPYFNAEAQRRRVRRGVGRVEHVERVEGIGGVSQGAPSLRGGAMKSEYSHQ